MKHNRFGDRAGKRNRYEMWMVRAPFAAVLLTIPFWVESAPARQDASRQIVEAVSPLKRKLRDGATVLGYSNGSLTVLRDGTNHYICLADDPRDRRFQVSCYHESLEPFMARGRELREAGKRGRELQRIRNAEIDSGSLRMPERAAVLSLYGIGEINARTGWPDSVTSLQVLYLPYATAEDTGLSDQPSRTSAYLMDAGTGRAHLMIPGSRWRYRPHEHRRRR